MTLTAKRVAVASIVIAVTVVAIFAVIMAGPLPANSAEATTLDKTTDFLSSVVGLDMAKYSYVQPSPPPGYENITIPTPSINNPLAVDDLLDIEAPSFEFESGEVTLRTMTTFYNGHLTFFNINSQDKYIYKGQPPTDILNEAKNLLRRYQTFLPQKYAIDSSFLAPMQNILDNLDHFSPTNTIIGNINFQVSIDGKTRVQWIYTENGTIMERKRVEF